MHSIVTKFDPEYIYPPFAIGLGILLFVAFIVIVVIQTNWTKIDNYFALRRHDRRERKRSGGVQAAIRTAEEARREYVPAYIPHGKGKHALRDY